MKPIRILIICLSLVVIQLFPYCKAEKKVEKLNIFAAASLKDVLSNTAEIYKKKTGIELSLNFASSGILARQIEQGADVDFFFSANRDWIDYISKKELLLASSKLELAQNKMALIVPEGSKLRDFENFRPEIIASLFDGRIAIGDPNHVPAGKYAQEILKHHNIWQILKNRALPCKNARETLLMVEMGEVELGIVYLSDAKKSKKVRCIYEFEESDSSPILYYSAHRTNPNSMVQDFQNFLKRPESKRIWKDYAFIVHD
ncbi:molybdate ABC transporter substrate-binding protein [Ancylomarina euxinus]|uniref:Molybdate ABC transporter substrate-binding protein n=1 Tax=Ancylomarina euxinus TaxID=2283627 RepID=A0A425Y1T1_9BACT|nr:molybdate ABC transporter substrate-binding protein [Ancylomarina euxinus]MCZ4695075.1 molybdate ABC transporter substrate-binding protein [Ancylomarina euxinus]MUP14989.1 molybdate ABC transporter substrate-binding protein [Ancylomarina euxinus]RRG21879.1 molybdate ABC transporter substrate-binding protein [Ancylomarina euxinus]